MTRIQKLNIQSAYQITPLCSCVTGLVNGKGLLYCVRQLYNRQINFVQKWQTAHLSLWHSETEWDNAMDMHD